MVTRAELQSLIKKVEVIDHTNEKGEEKKVIKRVNRQDYRGNGRWLFPSELGHDGHLGFIYVIHDCLEDKYYLGKKQYFGTGKANKGIISNWQWYISSSKELSASIQTHGEEAFEFIVLEEYRTKGTLSYAETWSLMYVETPSNQDRWYNKLVNGVSWTCREKITQRHKDRLQMVLDKKEFIHEVVSP